MSQAHTQIQKALVAHQKTLQTVKIFSGAYYYAQMMISRCNEAMKIEDEISAWKHFQG